MMLAVSLGVVVGTKTLHLIFFNSQKHINNLQWLQKRKERGDTIMWSTITLSYDDARSLAGVSTAYNEMNNRSKYACAW